MIDTLKSGRDVVIRFAGYLGIDLDDVASRETPTSLFLFKEHALSALAAQVPLIEYRRLWDTFCGAMTGELRIGDSTVLDLNVCPDQEQFSNFLREVANAVHITCDCRIDKSRWLGAIDTEHFELRHLAAC